MKVVSIDAIFPIIEFIVFCILFHHFPEGLSIHSIQSSDILFLLSSSLKPLDIECMKALHNKVNIIPIIAKADALTTEELSQMKETVCFIFIDNSHVKIILSL